MSKIKEALSKAQQYHNQVELIDEQIDNLSMLASKVIEIGVDRMEMIIETTPLNGAQAHVIPVIDNAKPAVFGEAPRFEPIGYQRFYLPEERGDEDIIAVTTSLPSNIALAVIDTMLCKLKMQRSKILSESKSILKI